MKRKQHGFAALELIIIVVVLVAVGAVGLLMFNRSNNSGQQDATGQAQNGSFDPANPPKILQAAAFPLDNFYSVSKFRSGAGHDFSGNGETCRSMKHYFDPLVNSVGDASSIPSSVDPDEGVPVYSPVDAKIRQIVSEQFPLGKQFYLVSDEYPTVTLRLFHVYPLDTTKEGQSVKAGDRIGTLLKTQGTDIAVEVQGEREPTLISYFDIMPDNLFAEFQARGVTERSQLTLSKADRDAAPLQCNGEQFANNSDHEQDYFRLSGYQPMPKQ